MANLVSGTILTATGKKGTGAATNGAITVDLDTGNFFEVDLQSSNADITTFTISNPNQTTGQISSFVLKITQGSTARQISWDVLSSGFRWIDDTGPTLTLTDNAIDILSFTSHDKGVNWYSSIVGFNFQ